MEKERIKKIINEIESLPSLPPVVAQLIQIVDDPNISAPEIGKIIVKDQSMTIRLLQIVNSAYYGFPRQISTINQATVILGFNALKNLALSAFMFDTLHAMVGNKFFSREEFWKHSLGCAAGSKVIAKHCRYSEAEETFTAGLIHDIGKVILDQFFHDDFTKILTMSDSEDINLLDAEKEVLGATHCEIGGWMSEKWNLPPRFLDVISFHHFPDLAEEYPKLTAIVFLANMITKEKKIGFSGSSIDQEPEKIIPNNLNISESTLDEIIEEYDDTYEKCSIFLTMGE